MQELQHRAYGGHSFRPKPYIYQSDDLLIVASSWGSSDMAQRCAEKLMKRGSEIGDAKALLEMNLDILRNENKREYSEAVEIAIFRIKNKTLSWAHVGSPHVFLSYEKGLQPLCYYLDWSAQFNQAAPIVCSALGLQENIQINSGSYKIEPGHRLIMLSRSYVPSTFYAITNLNLQNISDTLIAESEQNPFWVGLVEL